MKKIKYIIVALLSFTFTQNFAQSIIVNPATDLPAEVIACGDEETFTFRVYGPTVADEKIEVQLPTESEYVSLIAPASGVTVDDSDLKKPIFNIVNALAGPSNFIDIELGSAITAGSTISDTIDFSVAIARGCNVLLVVNTSNNSCICDIADTSIGYNADLSLIKTVNYSNPDEGDNITFTLTVTNNATSAPTNIVVKDIIPTDFTYNHPNFSTTQGTVTYIAGELEWNLGGFTLPVGDSIDLTTVTVDVCGEFVNQAEITNSSINDPDSTPNSGN